MLQALQQALIVAAGLVFYNVGKLVLLTLLNYTYNTKDED